MKTNKLVFDKEIRHLSKLINKVDEIKQALKRDFKDLKISDDGILAKLDKVTGNGFNAIEELARFQVLEEVEEYED